MSKAMFYTLLMAGTLVWYALLIVGATWVGETFGPIQAFAFVAGWLLTTCYVGLTILYSQNP